MLQTTKYYYSVNHTVYGVIEAYSNCTITCKYRYQLKSSWIPFKKGIFNQRKDLALNFIIARITFKNIGEQVKITGTAQNSSSESSSVSSSDSSSLSSSTKPATLRSFKIFCMIDGIGQRCLFAFKKRSILSESGSYSFFLLT